MPHPILDVEVWAAREAGEPGILKRFGRVNYISLVNSDTFGIPALVNDPRVQENLPATILYINPENIVAVKAERTR